MAYVDRIKPEEYNALLAAFGQVGAPIFARVAEIINKQRYAAGNPKTIAFTTLKKAWEKGWTEQVGGRPAPALKTLFPNAPPVSYKHDAPEPEVVAPEPAPALSNPPAARAGAAPMGASDAVGQASVMVRHNEETKTLVNPMISPAQAEALTVLDPLKAAILRLDEGRANALLNEMVILGKARTNLIGLEEIASTLINTLAGRRDIITRLVGDLAHSDAATLRTVRDTLREIGQFMKDIALTNKTIQESQRLLVGMPQRIEERRGGARTDEETDDRAIARMSAMLRTPFDKTQRYDGEETGEVQDAEFTDEKPEPESAEPTGETSTPPGKEQANEPEPTA
jgi:hypothetical protein